MTSNDNVRLQCQMSIVVVGSNVCLGVVGSDCCCCCLLAVVQGVEGKQQQQ